MEPPQRLLEAVREARLIVEVGAGSDFSTALAFARASPGARVRVTDVRDSVLRAPAPLEAVVDDVTQAELGVYEGATLLYGVRIPEELQVPTARVARRVGASLALRPLKDEWADVRDVFPEGVVLSGGWRLFSC